MSHFYAKKVFQPLILTVHLDYGEIPIIHREGPLIVFTLINTGKMDITNPNLQVYLQVQKVDSFDVISNNTVVVKGKFSN